jgi:hypothetical protein
MKDCPTKHTIIHNMIDIGEELTVSVELGKNEIHGTLRESKFSSSSEIIVFENAIWFMSEQGAAANQRR